MKAIGPTFGAELIAAGLGGLPFAWGSDGTFCFDPAMTAEQIAAVEAVYAAHDPTKPGPNPPPTPRAWLERLSATTQAAITKAAATDATGGMLLWLLKAAGNPSIDVTSAETVQGVGALAAAGIITAAEQTALLAP